MQCQDNEAPGGLILDISHKLHVLYQAYSLLFAVNAHMLNLRVDEVSPFFPSTIFSATIPIILLLNEWKVHCAI